MLLDEIPSLDLADFRSTDPARKANFVQDLGNAFNTIGFVAIKGHGLSEPFTNSLYQHVETFFKSTDEKKKAVDPDGYFELAKKDFLGNPKAFLEALINFDKDNIKD
jgi:isopenicillin N synthase-like dioxygenase